MESQSRNERLESDARQNMLQLRDMDLRYRILIDNIQDYVILMLDRNGYVVSWNSSAERMKGWSADEIIGKHFSCFYPPAEIENGLPMRVLGVRR